MRWCLDVVSLSRALEFTVFLGADVVRFCARNVSFGILLASSVDFWWISGPIFEKLSANSGTRNVFFVMRGLNLDWCEMCCENKIFTYVVILLISVSFLYCLLFWDQF